MYSTDQPDVHDMVAKMRSVVDEYGDTLLIAEVYLPPTELVAYYGVERSGAHLPFNFELITLPWDARRIAAAIDEYEASLPSGAWPTWVLSNHDKRRVASRVGREQARIAAMLLLTLRGTPTIYYGDELGMTDVPIPADRVRDPVETLSPGRGRDPHRTPMRWTGGEYSGFSTVEPWLPVGEDVDVMNVATERNDRQSMLSLYRALIALRRREPALSAGTYRPLPTCGDVIAFMRAGGDRVLLVAANLGGEPQEITRPELHGNVLLSTHLDHQNMPVAGVVRLRANEGIIASLDVCAP